MHPAPVFTAGWLPGRALAPAGPVTNVEARRLHEQVCGRLQGPVCRDAAPGTPVTEPAQAEENNHVRKS
jgi:hypothetical protein